MRFAAFGCVVIGAAAVARRESGTLEEAIVL
jgi:hypothetical protein